MGYDKEGPMTKLCLHCGRANHDKALHCKRCGHALKGAMALEPQRGAPPLFLILLLMTAISVVTVFVFFSVH